MNDKRQSKDKIKKVPSRGQQSAPVQQKKSSAPKNKNVQKNVNKSSRKHQTNERKEKNSRVVSIKRRPDSKWKRLKLLPDFLLQETMNAIPRFWTNFRKTVAFRVISMILLVFTAVYLVSLVYKVSAIPVKTEIALEETIVNDVSAEFFAVRDEQLIYNQKSGRIVPLVSDGERVSKGDTIALVFSDDNQASCYTRMQELEDEIKYYESLDSLSGVGGADIGNINSKIFKSYTSFIEAADNRDFSAMNELTDSLKDRLTRRQMLSGKSVDFQEALKSGKEEYENLKSKELNYSSIIAERSGYYISQTDGYEKAFDYKNVNGITPSELEETLKKEHTAENNVVGKIVDGSNWYMFCEVDNDVANQTAVGKTITVELPFSSVSDLKATVEKMQPSADKNKTVITLKCSNMGSELAYIRNEIGQLEFSSYTGFRLSNDVIYDVDGEKGVYVLQGNKVVFRKINIIYTGDGFVIANNTGANEKGDMIANHPDYIHLHDKVIVKGDNLSDGKLI